MRHAVSKMMMSSKKTNDRYQNNNSVMLQHKRRDSLGTNTNPYANSSMSQIIEVVKGGGYNN
jgi:hypothetical protein